MNITKYSFDNFIKTNDSNIEYSILYTTWDYENTVEFENYFPQAFIQRIEQPNLSNYQNILDNYTIDSTNPEKNIEHYLLGLYIKKMSYTTIINFEAKNNIQFDFIISLRTSIYIGKQHLSNFYKMIKQNLNNTIFVAIYPCYDIYVPNKALPDVISISDKETMKKNLEQIDNLENCNVVNTRFFHPETSFYNNLENQKINIIRLKFYAFPQKLWSEP